MFPETGRSGRLVIGYRQDRFTRMTRMGRILADFLLGDLRERWWKVVLASAAD